MGFTVFFILIALPSLEVSNSLYVSVLFILGPRGNLWLNQFTAVSVVHGYCLAFTAQSPFMFRFSL